MGNKIIQARQIAKTDTSSAWDDSTLSLMDGELAINKTTGEMRFGDGVDTFNNSPKIKTVPLSHSSSSTEYGSGTNSNYGHVKLSDSTSSTSDVSSGTAATPFAIKTVNDSKADKQNPDGGAAMGAEAVAISGGAIGNQASAVTGGAVGDNAQTTSSGGAIGDCATAATGGAAGENATTDAGGAVGLSSESTSGGAVGHGAIADTGGAIGKDATSSDGGGAVGENASAQEGGAVGHFANSTSRGFAGGYMAQSSNGGAIGYDCSTLSGGVAGLKAESTTGFAGGSNAKAISGCAVGESASATSGGAIGQNAAESEGGGAIGEGASSGDGGGAVGYGAVTETGGAVGSNAYTDNGGAVGYNAYSLYGGAVGYNAKSGSGFAGGSSAQVYYDSSVNQYIDAIQLGTGTNNNEQTLQVYDYQVTEYNGIKMYLKDVGDISTLETTNKTNIVSAINELSNKNNGSSSSSAKIYSETPVLIGSWIDGTPVWRVAVSKSFADLGYVVGQPFSLIIHHFLRDELNIIKNTTHDLIIIDYRLMFSNDIETAPDYFADNVEEIMIGYRILSGENHIDLAAYVFGWIEFAAPESNFKTIVANLSEDYDLTLNDKNASSNSTIESVVDTNSDLTFTNNGEIIVPSLNEETGNLTL